MTTQPVSRLRLKLATLSQILVQAEGDEAEQVEVKNAVGFGWLRAKAEWLWSRQTTEPFGVATTIEALKSVDTRMLKQES